MVATPDSGPPRSLAENLAAPANECPIPFTHDRLSETHYWWHEMARNYHEPTPFRYSLGAFIQAARSVTFMLQKERAAFEDFGWYQLWVKQAEKDPMLRWVSDARTDVVHRQALEPYSSLEIRCIGNPRDPHGSDEDPLHFRASPFACTHSYIRAGPSEDHGHEFTRHWSLDDHNDRDLLEVCADVYDRMDALVGDAHRRLGAKMTSHAREGSPRALPCLNDVAKHKLARTIVRDGREIWEDEPPGLHQH